MWKDMPGGAFHKSHASTCAVSVKCTWVHGQCVIVLSAWFELKRPSCDCLTNKWEMCPEFVRCMTMCVGFVSMLKVKNILYRPWPQSLVVHPRSVLCCYHSQALMQSWQRQDTEKCGENKWINDTMLWIYVIQKLSLLVWRLAPGWFVSVYIACTLVLVLHHCILYDCRRG